MSGSKTEKPTPKKKKDSSKKGNAFKSKDLIISCLILVAVQYLIHFFNFEPIANILKKIMEQEFDYNISDYVKKMFTLVGIIFIPFLALCVISASLPSLLQTGFSLASKALKIDFTALNPVKGLKKIFSIRTAKDTIKALLFLFCFVIAIFIFWNNNKIIIFSQVNSSIENIFQIWSKLFSSLVYTCFFSVILVFILDVIAEYLLYIKDLKMDKQEVKREHKELDGNPEIKSKRKELHMELLSEQVKSDVENSKVIIANPTHIAVGIYLNKDVIGIPFISVLEKNQRALAVRKYAKEVGVPVVENVKLARRILKTHKRYSFIKLEELDEVLEVLVWLEQVENSWVNEK